MTGASITELQGTVQQRRHYAVTGGSTLHDTRQRVGARAHTPTHMRAIQDFKCRSNCGGSTRSTAPPPFHVGALLPGLPIGQQGPCPDTWAGGGGPPQMPKGQPVDAFDRATGTAFKSGHTCFRAQTCGAGPHGQRSRRSPGLIPTEPHFPCHTPVASRVSRGRTVRCARAVRKVGCFPPPVATGPKVLNSAPPMLF